jgi:hypothetical protein
MNVDMHL